MEKAKNRTSNKQIVIDLQKVVLKLVLAKYPEINDSEMHTQLLIRLFIEESLETHKTLLGLGITSHI